MKEIFKELKFNKNNIYNILLSLMTYFGIIMYIGVYNELNYSIFVLLLYIPIYILFAKINLNFEDRNKKISIVIAIILDLLIVIGKRVYNLEGINNAIIFDLKNTILMFFQIIFLFPLIFKLLKLLYHYSNIINLKSDFKRNKKSINKFFIFSWVLIFICYLPYFWRYYPAKLTVDSFLQIKFISERILTDVHPFIQTSFVGLIYKIGRIIFNNNNFAIALYTIVQMIIMSGFFAYVCSYLYRKNFNIKICLFVLLSYAVLPQYTHYSITLWKDVIFGGSFILIMISLLELIESKDKLKSKYLFLFVLGSLIMLFFRNNGIYILLFITPFILYTFRKKHIVFVPLILSLISVYYIVKGPIFNAIGVQKTNSVETLSVPLQQIARVFAMEKEIDQESLSYLNSIMDTTKIKENYVPFIADPIKNMIDRDKAQKTQQELLKTWKKLLVKYPQIYIEAYLSETTGYWSPDVNYWATMGISERNEYGVTNKTNMPKILTKIIDITPSKRIPFANICWSTGLGFIILLLSFSVSLYKKSKFLIVYSLFLGLWITMMIAAPVYAEYRYVYGLFTCMPLIVLIPYTKDNKKEK